MTSNCDVALLFFFPVLGFRLQEKLWHLVGIPVHIIMPHILRSKIRCIVLITAHSSCMPFDMIL